MPKARLGGVVLDVVRDEKPSYQATVSENAVENGNEIADHVKRSPLSFSITAVLTGSDWHVRRQRIQEMYDTEELVRYVGREIHENMVVQSLSPSYTKEIANGVVLNITLRKVEVVRVEIREFYEPDPVTGIEPEANEVEPDLRQAEIEEVDEETSDSLLVSLLKKLGVMRDEEEQ